MNSLFSLEFNLELLNGNWAIAALSMMIICAAYLQHEFRARRILPFGSRRRLTEGMRVAIAIATLSLGIFVRSAEMCRWLVFGGNLNQDILMIGGVIAVVGFLCLIREKSVSLYGRAPWLCTLIVLVVYSAASIFLHFR